MNRHTILQAIVTCAIFVVGIGLVDLYCDKKRDESFQPINPFLTIENATDKEVNIQPLQVRVRIEDKNVMIITNWFLQITPAVKMSITAKGYSGELVACTPTEPPFRIKAEWSSRQVQLTNIGTAINIRTNEP